MYKSFFTGDDSCGEGSLGLESHGARKRSEKEFLKHESKVELFINYLIDP